MGRRFACVLFLTACVLVSCNGSQGLKSDGGAGRVGDRGPLGSKAGAGQSGASSGGGASPLGGSGVSAGPGIPCGSVRCAATGTLAACCVDAATSMCGVEDKSLGIACGVPAVADPRCPVVKVDFVGATIMFKGCCTAEGICGGFNLGSPCAVVAIAAEDDAGVTPNPQQHCN
jgi:hypothetical protein